MVNTSKLFKEYLNAKMGDKMSLLIITSSLQMTHINIYFCIVGTIT